MGYHSIAKAPRPGRRDKMSPQQASKSLSFSNKRKQLFQQPQHRLPALQKLFKPNSRSLKLSKTTSSMPKRSLIPVDPNPFKRKLDEGNGVDELLEKEPKKLRGSDSEELLAIYQRRTKVKIYAATVRQKRNLAKRIPSAWAGMKTSSQQGMFNPGVLCYRNSLFQAILHQPKFVHWIVKSHHPENCVSDDPRKCVPCQLRLLIVEYWKGGGALTKTLRETDALFTSMGWRAGSASGQGDPDEHSSWIFGAIRGAVPSSVFSSFEALMHLGTISVIRCPKCGHESRTTGGDDRGISLPITPRIANGSVDQYLQKYLVEVIEDYSCESCKDKASKKKRVLLISHAPDILTVQLKRFDYNGVKDNSFVGINTTFDLGRFRDADNHGKLCYELSAVIKHAGTSGFGHYTCSAKGPDGDWYNFNDRSMSKSSAAEATGKGPFTPYILYYQRIDS